VRILTVGNMFPPHHLGGYELIWRDAVRHLIGRGHSVRVLATGFRRDDRSDATEEPGQDVHRELDWYWRDHDWPRFSVAARLRLERENAAKLKRHIEEFRPDVIGWWAMGGMSLSLIEQARRMGYPAAGFVCDEWMIYGPRVDAWMRLVRRPVIGTAAGLLTRIPTGVDYSEVGPWLFPSTMLRDKSAALRRLTDTTVVHQGVDREVFTPGDPLPWGWRLLYAGRIDPRKGIDLAVSALSLLPEAAVLDIVGNGDPHHTEELRVLAGEEGVAQRVHFHAAESRSGLRDRYAAADAVVFPVRWEEPWGLVPLEAMTVGRPVVASGRGGSGEYLEDGSNCLLFDPDQGPAALAQAVTRLAEDEPLRTRLREGGAQTSGAISADGFNIAVEETLIRAARRAPRSPA
jgi:glycogen synthase